jgi:hypothetical protein
MIAFILRNALYKYMVILFGLTKCSGLLYGFDEQGLCGISGQIHHSVHRWYIGLVQERRIGRTSSSIIAEASKQ